MSIKHLLLCFLLIFTATATSFGQEPLSDTDFTKPVGDTGEEEAARRAKFLTKLHNDNAQINTNIALKKLYHHHIDVNETLKDLGDAGKITQNIDFYFELKGPNFVLKKVLILTNRGSQQSYEDLLFDNTGEVLYYAFNEDINNPESKKRGYYFTTKTLLYYSEDGLVLAKDEYGTEIFQKGVEVLNKAEDYKLLMQTLTRVHPKE